MIERRNQSMMSSTKRCILGLKLTAAALLDRHRHRDIPLREYLHMYAKIMRTLHASGIEDVYHQGKAMLDADVVLKSDRLTVSDDPADPILVVVVKDDLLRMQLLFDHYRRIGVHQFIVMDNCSTDGTLEYAMGQSDTRVYQVRTRYFTTAKEGWVEYAMRRAGVNRWFLVVDSDEMLDYPGSESHPVQELIAAQARLGNTRLNGYMLDMLSDQPLYAVTCNPLEIPTAFRWFSCDNYQIKHALYGMNIITGGPRQKLVTNKVWAGKCPLFYFSDEMTNLNAHFQYPFVHITHTNLCVVLRHYKFLATDKKTYQKRATQESGFGSTAEIYAQINSSAAADSPVSLLDEACREYQTSYSLTALPLLYVTFPQDE